jgi:hypothetical protein
MDSNIQALHQRLEETQRSRELDAIKQDIKDFKSEVRYSIQNLQTQLQNLHNQLGAVQNLLQNLQMVAFFGKPANKENPS